MADHETPTVAILPSMLDMRGVDQVEVRLTETQLWVNVDGVCKLRIYGIRNRISIYDDREEYRL